MVAVQALSCLLLLIQLHGYHAEFNGEVRYHIRGPKPQYAVVGEGSSITCSIAAPTEDETFTLLVNDIPYDNPELDSPWSNAEFSRGVYNLENGTVLTSIEGFVYPFTEEHNNAHIACSSEDHDGGISMTISLRSADSTECWKGGFRCPEQCIPDYWVCDGYADCDDEFDERNCADSCRQGEFKCPEQCIPDDWECDGSADCDDGFDERHCP